MPTSLPLLESQAIAACCSPLTGGAVDDQTAETLGRMFKALGDPTRVKLLSLIAPTGLGARTPSSGYAPTCHLATNAHAFYLACDDARRRLCNQAFFTKITLKENLDVTSEFTGIYETILDPINRLHAEFWQRTGQLHPDVDLEHNEETLPHDQRGKVGTSTKWWR